MSEERKRVQVFFAGESRVEKSHRDKCNINSIMSRYQRTGLVPVSRAAGAYGDFSGVVDYHTCVQAQRDAEGAFMSLPAEVRKRFRNDPGELLAFLGDEANREEAIKIGLIPKPEPEPRVTEPEPPVADGE